MKKIVLTSVCALAMSGIAFAQGLVNWNVLSPAALTVQTNSSTYSSLFGGGSAVGGSVGNTTAASSSFYYELLYTSYSGSQATITSLGSLLSWSDTGLEATNSTSAGKVTPINGSAAATVPWAAGVTSSIVLVGWSANLGTSWGVVSNELANWSKDGIANAYFGVTSTGYITGNTAPASGATLFNTSATANGLPISALNTQMYLLPVPEPATMALMGLGGLSLLLFRRQRKS
jgi:hypothetical protein